MPPHIAAHTTVPAPTPLPHASTPVAVPAPKAIPVETLTSLHDTQNSRWLQHRHPSISRRIQSLPWVQDGLSKIEKNAIDNFLYTGVDNIDDLRVALDIPWIQDGISEIEYEVLDQLNELGYSAPSEVVQNIIAMPFLESPDVTDVLALQGMRNLAFRRHFVYPYGPPHVPRRNH